VGFQGLFAKGEGESLNINELGRYWYAICRRQSGGALPQVYVVDWYRGYGATTVLHLGRKLAGPMCTAFSSAHQPQRRSTSNDMRALW
jgi:hypothetical protein